jgi:hypothetical protein
MNDWWLSTLKAVGESLLCEGALRGKCCWELDCGTEQGRSCLALSLFACRWQPVIARCSVNKAHFAPQRSSRQDELKGLAGRVGSCPLAPLSTSAAQRTCTSKVALLNARRSKTKKMHDEVHQRMQNLCHGVRVCQLSSRRQVASAAEVRSGTGDGCLNICVARQCGLREFDCESMAAAL